MSRFNVMLAVLLVSTAVHPAAVPAETVPIIATVEIRGLNALKNDIVSIAAALQMPVPPEMISGFMGGLFLSPALEGLDADAEFRLHIVESESMGAPPLVFDIPVSDDGAYLKILKSGASDSGEADGILRLVLPAQPGPSIAMGMPLYVAPGKDRILMGYDRNSVALLSASAVMPPAGRVDGTLALTLDSKALRDMANKMYAGMDAALANVQRDEDMPDMAAAMQAQRRLLLGALNQLNSYALGIGVRGPYLSFQSRWTPATESILARLVNDLRPPTPGFLRVTSGDAWVSAVGYLALPDEAIDALLDFARALYAAMPDGEDMVAEMEMAMEIARDQLQDGSYAFYILPPTGNFPIDMAQFFEVDNPSEFREKLIENTTRMGAMYGKSKLYEGSEIELEDPRTYRDISIDRVTQRLQFKGQDDISEIMPDFLNWFNNTRYEYAFLGTTMIQTIGSEQTMNDAIDRVLDGDGEPIHSQRAFHSIFPDAPTDAIDYSYISLGRIVAAILKMTDQFPEEVLNALPLGPVALGAFSVVDGSDLKVTARLSVSDLGTLIQTFAILKAQTTAPMQDTMDDDWDPFAEDDPEY